MWKFVNSVKKILKIFRDRTLFVGIVSLERVIWISMMWAFLIWW